jgi:uncharacterized Ntn-hydrolase superfamily protein
VSLQRTLLARCLLAVLLFGGTVSEASATWSIIAIHPRTGTIGVAAASCSGGVFGIQAVAPGTGAVIVQAESNDDARSVALKMLREGAPLDAILAKITDPSSGYAPERQQYAILARGAGDGPRTFTGQEVPGIKGSASSRYVSVQGNTLASSRVIPDTVAALGQADWPDDLSMARALMRALSNGAAAGGDRRCGRAGSNTAFISLHRATDPTNAPWVSLSVNRIPVGVASGTAELQRLFAAWLRDGMRQPSTATFVVPEVDAPASTP